MSKEQSIKPFYEKTWFILTTAVIFFTIIAQLIPHTDDATTKTTEKSKVGDLESTKAKAVLTDKEKILSLSYNYTDIDLNSLNNAFKFTLIVEKFKTSAALIVSAKQSIDKETKKEALLFEKKLITYQKNWLPKLRKSYTAMVANTLWENDVNVRIAGNSNTAITFIATYFYTNKNIKIIHESVYDMLYDLRFKRVNYKFSEHGAYTYFNIDSPKDSNLY